MNKILISIFAFFLLLTSSAFAKPLSLEEIQESACRVTNYSGYGQPQSLGSGTVVKEDENVYYVLTNGHVVSGGFSFTVEFFKEGAISRKIPAKLAWKNYVQGTSIDLAILAINKQDLGGYSPRVIKLAPKDYTIDNNTMIKGSGCPNGYWLLSWDARVTKNAGYTMYFNMPPIGGQSGSGILTDIKIGEDFETRLVGVVTWRFEDQGMYGGGVNNSRINQILTQKAKPDRISSDWRHASTCSQQIVTEDTKCSCGHSLKEHYIKYDIVTKQPRLTKDNKAILYCPTQKYILNSSEIAVKASQYFNNPNCPNGWCPWSAPRKPPSQDGNNGEGGNNTPPNIFGEEYPQETPEPPQVDPNVLEKLKEEYKKLLEKCTLLEKEKDTLHKMNDELVAKIKSATENVEKLLSEKTKTEEEKARLLAEKESIQSTITEMEKEKSSLEENRKSVEENLKKLEEEKTQIFNQKREIEGAYAEKLEDNKKLEDEKQTLVTESAGLKKKAEDALKTIKDLEKLVEEKKTWIGEIVGNENATWTERILMLLFGSGLGAALWHKYVYPKLLSRGKIPAWIIQRIGKRILKKKLDKFTKDNESVYNSIDDTDYEDDDELAEHFVDPDPQFVPVKKKLEVDHNVNEVSHRVSGEVQHNVNVVSYPNNAMKAIKEHFANLEREGETDSAKMWAMKASLYKDAVNRLRKGNLTVHGEADNNGNKVIRGLDAADTIDNYVLDQLYTKIQNNDLNIELFDKNNLYTQGYTGTLYKEAVENLRSGKMIPPVLNNVVIADAIESYVKKQYLDKVFPSHDRCGK